MTTASSPRPRHSLPFSKRAALGVAVLAVLLVTIHWPVLSWLPRAGIRMEPLLFTCVLVLYMLYLNLSEVRRVHPRRLHRNRLGIELLGWTVILLAVALYIPVLFIPLALGAFSCSLAALVAFLWGQRAVAKMVPALVVVAIFGVILALAPRLDWPLRVISARQAASLMNLLHYPTDLAILAENPPQLAMATANCLFIVASECNGLAVLSATLVSAVFLAFRYQLLWPGKLILILLVVPIAVGGNLCRILTLMILSPRISVPYRVLHEGFGTLFFWISLYLIWKAAQTLRLKPVTPATPK